jgi:hypothetical protein
LIGVLDLDMYENCVFREAKDGQCSKHLHRELAGPIKWRAHLSTY